MAYSGIKKRAASLSGSGTVRCDTLLGIDSSVSESGVSLKRADGKSYYTGKQQPGSLNMIRSALGEVSKRAGFRMCAAGFAPLTVDFVIPVESEHGNFCFFVTDDQLNVTDFDFQPVTSVTMYESFKSCSAFAADKYVYFMNGNRLFIFDMETHGTVSVDAYGGSNITDSDTTYLPTAFIACTPDGSGVGYESVNLLNPYIAEQYIPDGVSTVYTLHFDPSGDVQAFRKDERGVWVPIDAPTVSGRTVTFSRAPDAPIVDGEDGLRLLYKRDSFAGNLSKLACCTCGTAFGVSGYKDRVFLSGNDEHTGKVFYTELNQPLYFPDLNYIKVGSADTRVKLLAGRDVYLSVICNDNVYTVQGTADITGEYTDFAPSAVFAVTGIFKTPSPISHPAAVFDNELVYLTESGVCAVTASGVLDERCSQIRSELINYHLLDSIQDSIMLAFGDFLVISDKTDRLYILDGKQFMQNASLPFSHRQYEGYIWTGIPAKCMWTLGDTLYFTDGTDIFCFNKGFESNNEYHDEKAADELTPINAYWETPAIYCTDFNLNKFFMRMGVLLGCNYGSDGAPLNTGVRISAKFDNGPWRVIKDYDGEHCVFRYGNIAYPRFVYWNTPDSYAVYRRLLHKKGRSIKLRFENSNTDEPFTLQGFNIEYLKM